MIHLITSKTGIVERWEHFVERRARAYVVFSGDLIEELLHLTHGYVVVDVLITSELSGSPIASSPFDQTGLVVLGISGPGGWTPIPTPEHELNTGD